MNISKRQRNWATSMFVGVFASVMANAIWTFLRLFSFVKFPHLPILPTFSYFYFFIVAFVCVIIGRYLERESMEERKHELRMKELQSREIPKKKGAKTP